MMWAMRKSTHTPEYDALCSCLKRVREKAGLSQRQLAVKLNVPHSWVAKVEMGERRLDLIEFAWFTRFCGEDPARLAQELLRQIVEAAPHATAERRRR